MIYTTIAGEKVDLLFRFTGIREHIYAGLMDGVSFNLYFDYNFNVKIRELPDPIEFMKRLITDQTINDTTKRGIIHLIRMYCNLTETEQRLTKLVYEMAK